MTVHPITLDLSKPSQIGNYNMISMQPPCIYINVSQPGDICSWITSKEGWQAITSYDIMLLVDGYLMLTNLGYTVRMQDINGAIAYYLNMLSSGNNFTGCSFV